VRLSLVLQETRVGQWLMSMVRDLKLKSAKSSSWHGMEMFLAQQLPPDDPRRERVYRNFQQNLHDILQAGQESGARVVLNTVAVNLKDCSPFASLPPAGLSTAERADCQRLASDAAQARQQGRYEDAAGLFAQAAKLEPLAADLQYGWAQCLWSMTNFAAAREHFQKACDCDALPFRADSRLNDLIRQAARQSSSSNLFLFDAAAALAAGSSEGICGDETFYEHVHFNSDGNYRLGLAWAGVIAPLLPEGIQAKKKAGDWLSQAVCEQRLGLTDWNRMLIVNDELQRRQQAPLNGQANNGWEMEVLSNQLRVLQQRADNTAAARARALYFDDIQRDPDDFLLLINCGETLGAMKDWTGAAAVWKQAQVLLPQHYLGYFQAALMLENAGQLDEAESDFRKTVELYPQMTAAWFEMSNIHASEGKYELALQECQRALSLEPEHRAFHICLGKVLSKMNRSDAAIEQFRIAIHYRPEFWDAHLFLAGELYRAGRMAEATGEYNEVVRLRPNSIQDHLDLGRILSRQGLRDWAKQQFQEVLRLDPNNDAARQDLAALQN
jgi:tetratricopeptide (TPR) repeat protein